MAGALAAAEPLARPARARLRAQAVEADLLGRQASAIRLLASDLDQVLDDAQHALELGRSCALGAACRSGPSFERAQRVALRGAAPLVERTCLSVHVSHQELLARVLGRRRLGGFGVGGRASAGGGSARRLGVGGGLGRASGARRPARRCRGVSVGGSAVPSFG